MLWFDFMDMHSGGYPKWKGKEHIYIEAPDLSAAIKLFKELTGRSPYHVSCDCCGEDYSIGESETLDESTHYWRKDYNVLTGQLEMTIDSYVTRDDVFVLPFLPI